MPATDLLTPEEYAAELCKNLGLPKPRRYPTPGAVAAALDPLTKASPVLDLVDAALVDLFTTNGADGQEIALPPQEGKSQRVSRRTPEWLLDHDPTLRIALVSYEKEKAVRWGRAIRQDVIAHPCTSGDGQGCTDPSCRGLHIEIRRDSSAAGRWETPQGGGVYCVGIGGALTGQPADVLIIDDPVKDRAAAESEKIRANAWDWWESVALPRLASPPKVILVMTRWHEDDLAGRIASRPSPLRWRRLILPGVAGDGDPLGRAPGEELPSVRGRAAGYFTGRRATMSPYSFNSIYQQRPTAPEGNFFRRAAFRYWRPTRPWDDGRERIECEGKLVTLADAWKFITVDVAASTKTSADFTVAACWAMSVEGELVLLDRVRARAAPGDHFALVKPLRVRWGADTVYVERGFFASTLVADARADGVPVAEVIADKDKVTRAIPAAGRLHAGRVWFPAETSGCPCGDCDRGVWLEEWCDELAAFDKGTHDDQVDVFSYAARVATADWARPRNAGRPAVPAVDMVAAAHRAATGNGHRELDIMNTQW